ncbi:MBOAT, membrane-bound O-acyltransferase family-domain-containing protein [Fennellomyces sp. T-0311]|nr:MBOAT, membrane-bound O-acyltransferase family-domain-containing protein [Fennellomyces sp. T-0311]
MVFIEIAGFMTRCKFYCVWLLSEGSCILSGFGYNGIREGRHRWDRLRNIAWFSVETSQSFKELSGYWNLGANNWLRHYVYLRVMPPGTKPSSGAVIATYTTSAIWHGFHPGYYMLFCIVGVYQVFTRRIRRIVRPLFMTTENPPKPLPWKKVYDVLGSFLCMRIASLLTIPFDLLFFSRVQKVWASVYYIHILLMVVAWPLLILVEPALMAVQKHRKSASNDKSTEDIVRELELKKRVM